MTQKFKNLVFYVSSGAILLNILAAYIWRQYPHLIWGMLSLGLLLVSFVFAILALAHKFRTQNGKSQIIRGVLLVFAVVLYPLFYAVLGFMAIGMSTSQPSS